MRKYGVIILSSLLILLCPVLFRKYRVPLISNGKVAGFAARPLMIGETEFPVFVGTNEVFALSGDFFDFPVFIHTFADQKRFLCIYDYDVAVLVFVVDTGASTAPVTHEWPTDGSLRDSMAMFITNVVVRAQGLARLPTLVELQEVSKDLAGLTRREFKTRAFPCGDLGLYRFYWPKDSLLKDLKLDRSSAWPH